jgi:hypothetical protein
MQVNGVDNLPAYLDCLRTRPGEPAALLQDLLISVTNFFRDSECFQRWKHRADLFAARGPSDTVRVWVVACATGEEAYSVAMLLAEHARTLDARPDPGVRDRPRRGGGAASRATASTRRPSRPTSARSACAASSCASTAATACGASCASWCCSRCTTC